MFVSAGEREIFRRLGGEMGEICSNTGAVGRSVEESVPIECMDEEQSMDDKLLSVRCPCSSVAGLVSVESKEVMSVMSSKIRKDPTVRPA